jgi:hypothetical protein
MFYLTNSLSLSREYATQVKMTIENIVPQTLTSLDEVRKLIEKHNAWGMTLANFEAQAARKVDGNTTTITTYHFRGKGMDFADVYSLLQYIHTFYESK